jgi:hypothetical protein
VNKLLVGNKADLKQKFIDEDKADSLVDTDSAKDFADGT